MQRIPCFKTSFNRNMQASGPYRYTAAFDRAFQNGLIDDKVLFFSQPIVMRGLCGSNESHKTECLGMKDVKINGNEVIKLNLTTAHFASEQWMDWKQDRRTLLSYSQVN